VRASLEKNSEARRANNSFKINLGRRFKFILNPTLFYAVWGFQGVGFQCCSCAMKSLFCEVKLKWV
jgi:hypothetical protein